MLAVGRLATKRRTAGTFHSHVLSSSRILSHTLPSHFTRFLTLLQIPRGALLRIVHRLLRYYLPRCLLPKIFLPARGAIFNLGRRNKATRNGGAEDGRGGDEGTATTRRTARTTRRTAGTTSGTATRTTLSALSPQVPAP